MNIIEYTQDSSEYTYSQGSGLYDAQSNTVAEDNIVKFLESSQNIE